MGKRHHTSKTDQRAKDAARNLTLLLPLRGVPCVDAGRLWLLRDVARPCPHPDGFAAALRADPPPPLIQWRHHLTPHETLPVDLPLLSSWTKALAELERDNLDRMMAEGA